MANAIVRNIPNTLTSCNLFSGCIAAYMAFHGNYKEALLFIVLGAMFDFFDGMTARLLHVSSPIGKELDSLADDITFGLAPAAIAFSLFKEVYYPDFLMPVAGIMPYTAFLIAVFSGLRLAKFNIDERQTSSFIGLPTPANALFWGSLIIGNRGFLVSEKFNAVFLFLFMLLFCFLLVAELPLFALKFKNLSWKENKIKYVFLIGCIPMFAFLKYSSFAAIIVWYLFLSILTRKQN